MTKRARAVFEIDGGAFIARISKPGVDVFSAADDELLLHEEFFAGQILETGYFAYSGSPVDVAFAADYGFVPLVMVWPVAAPGRFFPAHYHYIAGTGTILFDTIAITPDTDGFSASFNTSWTSGAFYQVVRKERA